MRLPDASRTGGTELWWQHPAKIDDCSRQNSAYRLSRILFYKKQSVYDTLCFFCVRQISGRPLKIAHVKPASAPNKEAYMGMGLKLASAANAESKTEELFCGCAISYSTNTAVPDVMTISILFPLPKIS